MLQRAFDIMFSITALIALSPILLLVMFMLRITGEGEVFFLQTRIGKGGAHFNLFKFATMLKNSPSIGTKTITIHNDPRVLPLGKILRKSKINELPQLVNVLKGDMSIIGPRPQTQRCFDAYNKADQTEIKKVRPGLSGLGSIIFRNETEMMRENQDVSKLYDDVIMPYKGNLEKWYVQNKSIFSYFFLIFMTIYVLIFGSPRLIFYVFPSLPKIPKTLRFHILGSVHE
ncbi:MAG: lipid carrier--UDP-N-acetylgalactosaminyltransferase [Legionellales bacterium]|nr:lipid carrier--UDP-N-acetylgalactosaminyltransferase [Legionellales bacterium]OUX66223.1 MAG: lipid carrier--UDP-N-acetylgalactosaminyltransferase [Gammaproteobacteria bacterium TMED281]